LTTIVGGIQGLGAPACAKLLTQWYSSSERGTAWSIWTASNNVGGFAAPWVAGTAAGMMGWRWGMWVPGFLALSVASIILFAITDKPSDKGFEAVEGVSNKKSESAEKDKDTGPSVKEILFQDVLPNPWVWLFAISYFFVYMVRQGTSSWFVHYLMNVKGISDLPVAAAQVSGLEVGGFVGALSAGARTDATLPTL
jgi:MFS transporter, OPA family, sugar phosphate sensor protein UhpC